MSYVAYFDSLVKKSPTWHNLLFFKRKLVFLGTKIVSSSENHPQLLLTNFGQKCVKRLLEDEKLLVVVGVKKKNVNRQRKCPTNQKKNQIN